MVTDKYLYRTREGYTIEQVYFLPNSEKGFGPDSHTYVIVSRDRDFVVGRDYNFAKGWWGNGAYGFRTLTEAKRYVEEYVWDEYHRRGSWTSHPESLLYVVDKGNDNQLDNYGIYDRPTKAFAKQYKLAVGNKGEYSFEIKEANGNIYAVVSMVDKDAVVAYSPTHNQTCIVNKNGTLSH